ncbi:MAG: hypothetical protein ACYTHM_24110 [Planctomycetota bacterium]|jgi:hypothetical protein
MKVLDFIPLYDASRGLPAPKGGRGPTVMGLDLDAMALFLKGPLPPEAEATSLLWSFLVRMFEEDTEDAIRSTELPMAVLCVEPLTDDFDAVKQVLESTLFKETPFGNRGTATSDILELNPPLESFMWCLVGKKIL